MLAPIVTMPFLLTWAAMDYAYFALAQTFDIQHQREERFKKYESKITFHSQHKLNVISCTEKLLLVIEYGGNMDTLTCF